MTDYKTEKASSFLDPYGCEAAFDRIARSRTHGLGTGFAFWVRERRSNSTTEFVIDSCLVDFRDKDAAMKHMHEMVHGKEFVKWIPQGMYKKQKQQPVTLLDCSNRFVCIS